jgi:hypothetical protein
MKPILSDVVLANVLDWIDFLIPEALGRYAFCPKSVSVAVLFARRIHIVLAKS